MYTHSNWLTFELFGLATYGDVIFLGTSAFFFFVSRFLGKLLTWGHSCWWTCGVFCWVCYPQVWCPIVHQELGSITEMKWWSEIEMGISCMKWPFIVITNRHRSFNLKPCLRSRVKEECAVSQQPSGSPLNQRLIHLTNRSFVIHWFTYIASTPHPATVANKGLAWDSQA